MDNESVEQKVRKVVDEWYPSGRGKEDLINCITVAVMAQPTDSRRLGDPGFTLTMHNDRATELNAQRWLQDFDLQRSINTPRGELDTRNLIDLLLKMVRRQGADLVQLAVSSAPVSAAPSVSEPQPIKLTRDNGSWIPEVLEQVLVRNSCGVSGHFKFQDNGGNCLLCQREARIRAEAREATIHENPDYKMGVDDALKIAIPIAKCSCADKIVDALKRHRAKVAATPPSPEPKPMVVCPCGLKDIPAGIDGVRWYWQRHAREGCTLELPNERCWCGLLRSEHVTGHADCPASPEGEK